MELLRKRANEEHPPQQKDIQQILKEEYGVTYNRKTVAGGVEVLRQLDCEIAYNKGYYLINEFFDDEEL